KLLPPPAPQELFHARTQLRDRYRCGQERMPWLTVGPRAHRPVGRVLDQLGDDIRVEDDHFEGVPSYASASKSGRLISHLELNPVIPALKRLTSSSLSPISLNRSYMRSPKPFSSLPSMGAPCSLSPCSSGSSRTASSKIARTSSSRLRLLR